MTEEDHKNLHDKALQREIHIHNLRDGLRVLENDELELLILEILEEKSIHPTNLIDWHDALHIVTQSDDWIKYIDKPMGQDICEWIDESLAKDIGYGLMNGQKRKEARVLKDEIEYYEGE